MCDGSLFPWRGGRTTHSSGLLARLPLINAVYYFSACALRAGSRSIRALGSFVLRKGLRSMMKRPPTVWLTQTLLIIFAVLCLIALVLNLMMLPGRVGQGTPIVGAAVGVSIILSFVLLLLAAFWGLAKRKMYGKRLGLVSLVLLWALFTVTQYFPPAGPWKRYEYDSMAQLVWAAIFQACVHALFLVLILRLGFARKVSEFFRGNVKSA